MKKCKHKFVLNAISKGNVEKVHDIGGNNYSRSSSSFEPFQSSELKVKEFFNKNWH